MCLDLEQDNRDPVIDRSDDLRFKRSNTILMSSLKKSYDVIFWIFVIIPKNPTVFTCYLYY